MSVRLLSAAVFVMSSLAFSAAAASDAPAATGAAASASGSSASAEASDGNDPDKIICKAAKKTGTRLAKRSSKICRTKAEWDRIELENQLMNQDIQRSLGASGPKG